MQPCQQSNFGDPHSSLKKLCFLIVWAKQKMIQYFRENYNTRVERYRKHFTSITYIGWCKFSVQFKGASAGILLYLFFSKILVACSVCYKERLSYLGFVVFS